MSAAFPSWWIYIIGPLAGGALGGWIWHYLKRGRAPAEAESQAAQSGDDTADGQAARQRAGKFLLEKSRTGKYRFTLLASNGQVLATSTDYERRQAALSGIESVKKNAPGAGVASQDGD